MAPTRPTVAFYPLGSDIFFAEAEGAQIRPDFVDVGEALGFAAAFAGLAPAGGELTIYRPERVLLFVVHDHPVDDVVFGVHAHSGYHGAAEELELTV